VKARTHFLLGGLQTFFVLVLVFFDVFANPERSQIGQKLNEENYCFGFRFLNGINICN